MQIQQTWMLSRRWRNWRYNGLYVLSLRIGTFLAGGGGYTSFIFIQQETACDQISNANQKFWESEFEDERLGQKQPTLSSPVSWNWCQSSALFSFAAGCTNFTVNISSVLEAGETVLCVHCALSESWRHLEALHFSPVDLVHWWTFHWRWTPSAE